MKRRPVRPRRTCDLRNGGALGRRHPYPHRSAAFGGDGEVASNAAARPRRDRLVPRRGAGVAGADECCAAEGSGYLGTCFLRLLKTH